MEKRKSPDCANCPMSERICRSEEGKGPVTCPTKTRIEVIERALGEYRTEEIETFARTASIQEAECYVGRERKPYLLHPVKPRVQEICEFAKKMGYGKIGLAFCSGLLTEAKIFAQILDTQGFHVVSVVCKVGALPKEHIGIEEDQKIRIGEFETMCSPIAQAMILNDEETDFNVLVGLCVGHDSLFFRYSEAFTTVLVVKDRLLGHNPAAALYGTSNYYARMLRPGF